MALKTSTTMDRFGTALLAMVAALPVMHDVAVVDGPPPPGVLDSSTWVALMDVKFEQSPAALNVSNFPRWEEYEQEVIIRVIYSSRESQAEASARAWELFSAVSWALRNNPSLDGFFTGDGQIIVAQISDGTFSKRATDTERESAVTFTVNVEARI